MARSGADEAILRPFVASVGRAFREARLSALLAVVALVWGLAPIMGETIPVNDGLGWDGVRFARMVEGGPGLLPARDLNSYYVQRVGPSFAVRFLLQAARVPLEPASIRWGFVALNLTLLTGALVLLFLTTLHLGLDARSRWTLCLGLFLNPANGRLPLYYAPLGDSTAFFLGALILWGYVVRRPAAVVAGFVAAVFSWPAAFLLLPLLLWPRPKPEDPPLSDPAPLNKASMGIAMAAALPLGAGLIFMLTRAVEMPDPGAWTPALLTSVGTNALQLGWAAGLSLVVGLTGRGSLRLRPSLPGVLVTAGLLAASVLYVRTFESGSLAFSETTYFREVLLFVRSRPFAALVGHAAYYSALSVAAAALWPRVLQRGLALGTGAFLTLVLCGFMALDAESRRLNAYWPLVALFTVLAMRGFGDRLPRFAILTAVMVLMSKLWWPLVGPALFAALYEPGNYFNTQGPSMSTPAFTAHGLAALVLGLWIVREAAREEAADPIATLPVGSAGGERITSAS